MGGGSRMCGFVPKGHTEHLGEVEILIVVVIMACIHLSKLAKVYILNVYSLLCTNYTSITLFLKVE